MKTQNSVSQKCWILHNIKKGYFKQKCQASEKYVHFYAHLILVWASFCMNYCINVAWHGDNQPVALLRCNEAQDTLIAVFRSSALLGLVSLIIYSQWGSGQGKINHISCICVCLSVPQINMHAASYTEKHKSEEEWRHAQTVDFLCVPLILIFAFPCLLTDIWDITKLD